MKDINDEKEQGIYSNISQLADATREILKGLGEDPAREGLVRTPERHAKALAFLTSGYKTDPEKMLKQALFTEDYDQMVIVKNIEFYSLCEHHLVPFFGKAHVAYIPKGQIVGLSKIARLVNVFARRLQVQERLTKQIATQLMETLKPQGVAVVLDAVHLCMMMRGVEKENSVTLTSQMCGVFQENDKTRNEFMRLIGR